jgi:hypothetical protein
VTSLAEGRRQGFNSFFKMLLKVWQGLWL